jgi:hypothetical protein
VSKESSDDASDIVAATPSAGASMATAAAVLGADLVVVALAWDSPPPVPGGGTGIITITFLMMISFVLFLNELHMMMRYEYIVSQLKLKGKEEKAREKSSREIYQIGKWVRYYHVTGLLFTMLAFWIISYKYLIGIAGYHVAILTLPFILFLLYWLPKVIGVEKEVGVFSRESLMQLLIQIVFLILICLDFLKIIKIY